MGLIRIPPPSETVSGGSTPMPSLPMQAQPAALLFNRANKGSVLSRIIRALVVSPHLEVRRPLLRTLEALCADVVVCATREQAEDVLSRQAVEIVFRDDHLPDGSYGDLLHRDHYDHRIPRIAVMTRTGEWELYFEAIAKGAFDVLRSPWYATDVEMTVIRALRDEDQPALTRAAGVDRAM